MITFKTSVPKLSVKIPKINDIKLSLLEERLTQQIMVLVKQVIDREITRRQNERTSNRTIRNTKGCNK